MKYQGGGKRRDEAWEVAIRYGALELGMTNREIAAEIGIGGERVRQILVRQRVLKLRCACGRAIQRATETLCFKCRVKEIPSKRRACATNGCGRKAQARDLCSRCWANQRWHRGEEQRAKQRAASARWLAKVKQDPARAAQFQKREKAARDRYYAKKRAEREAAKAAPPAEA